MPAVRFPHPVTHFRGALPWDLGEAKGGHGIPAFTRSRDHPALSIRMAPPHSLAHSSPPPPPLPSAPQSTTGLKTKNLRRLLRVSFALTHPTLSVSSFFHQKPSQTYHSLASTASMLVQARMTAPASHWPLYLNAHLPALHSPQSSQRDVSEAQTPGVLGLSYILT